MAFFLFAPSYCFFPPVISFESLHFGKGCLTLRRTDTSSESIIYSATGSFIPHLLLQFTFQRQFISSMLQLRTAIVKCSELDDKCQDQTRWGEPEEAGISAEVEKIEM